MSVGVREAAARLGISAQRVRALIASGSLPAERVGHAWVINEADIARPRRRSAGRPMSARMAGAFLILAAGMRPQVMPSEMSRLRQRLLQLADESRSPNGEPSDMLRAWMSQRAERLALSIHASDIKDVLADQRIQASGVSHPFAAMSGAPIAEGYVHLDDADSLIEDHFMVPAKVPAQANVVLHVVSELPPVSRVLVAADLADYRADREDRQAKSILDDHFSRTDPVGMHHQGVGRE